MKMCDLCDTRKALKAAEKLLDATPLINSPLYDDAMADLINDISSAYSLFMCMCPDEDEVACDVGTPV
jgi:hypothetical protein